MSKKISELTAKTTFNDTDLVLVSTDNGATFTSEKMTIAQLKSNLGIDLQAVLTNGNETNGKDLIITEGDNFKLKSFDVYPIIQMYDDGGIGIIKVLDTETGRGCDYGKSAISTNDNLFTLSANNGGLSVNFHLSATDNETKFTDGRTTKTGIEYSSDYSANYTDRSLVDKQFVIGQMGKLPNYTTTERDNLTPSPGWLIFNSTTSKAQCYDGSTWNDLW